MSPGCRCSGCWCIKMKNIIPVVHMFTTDLDHVPGGKGPSVSAGVPVGKIEFDTIAGDSSQYRRRVQTGSLWRKLKMNMRDNHMTSVRTHGVMISSPLRQNDVVTSFWCDNDVIIASCLAALLPSNHPVIRTFRWLSARLQYLQCFSNRDTAFLH